MTEKERKRETERILRKIKISFGVKKKVKRQIFVSQEKKITHELSSIGFYIKSEIIQRRT